MLKLNEIIKKVSQVEIKHDWALVTQMAEHVEVPYERHVEFINDAVYRLNEKELIKKWYRTFTGNVARRNYRPLDFDKSGNLKGGMCLTEIYYLKLSDGGEVYMDFNVLCDYETIDIGISEDSPQATELSEWFNDKKNKWDTHQIESYFRFTKNIGFPKE